MNKTARNILIVGSILLFFGSIGFYVYSNVKMSMKFCYKISGLKITSITSEKIDITLQTKIKNRSDFSVKLKSYKFNIWINEILVATVNQSLTQTIQNLAVSTLNIPVSIEISKLGKLKFKQIHTLALLMFTQPDKFIVRTEGVVSGEVQGVTVKDFPIDISMNYNEITAPSTDDDICKNFK